MRKIPKYLIHLPIRARETGCTKIAKTIDCRTTQKSMYKNGEKGIALLVALGAMIVILIIGSLAIYLISSGLNIARGQKRYQSAFEACEGGIEIGMGKVDSAFTYGVNPPHGDTLNVGRFSVRIQTDQLFASTVFGAAIKFARGYFGAGHAVAHGGVNLYYLVRAQSIGSGGEGVTIEIEQKKVLGID